MKWSTATCDNIIKKLGATREFPMGNIFGSSSRLTGAIHPTMVENKGAIQPPTTTYLGHRNLGGGSDPVHPRCSQSKYSTRILITTHGLTQSDSP
ncbi:hypothetical protein F511_32375 [Dorcoceras hygrometricum]|uniref:Uncharacterized protein n=1 Tax=Dorcoceras hygrometricum TaxID=472368 RepID=A0A2Z7DC78_9LAMI|nr:hypothetical protein F511_32375 [Dorcoceras hygrometricum]